MILWMCKNVQCKTHATENSSIELVPYKLLKRKFGAVEPTWQFCDAVANLHAKDSFEVDHWCKILWSSDIVRPRLISLR